MVKKLTINRFWFTYFRMIGPGRISSGECRNVLEWKGAEVSMLVLGIDPGSAITGYGIVKQTGNRLEAVDYGCIRTSPDLSLELRLQKIYKGIKELIDTYSPEHFAIEELFFNKNVRTALTVGHARGVIMLAGADGGLPAHEYTPLQVKQAVVGFGRAEKTQVQHMVKTILNLPDIPRPDDVADALAVAICHTHYYKMAKIIGGNK